MSDLETQTDTKNRFSDDSSRKTGSLVQDDAKITSRDDGKRGKSSRKKDAKVLLPGQVPTESGKKRKRPMIVVSETTSTDYNDEGWNVPKHQLKRDVRKIKEASKPVTDDVDDDDEISYDTPQDTAEDLVYDD